MSFFIGDNNFNKNEKFDKNLSSNNSQQIEEFDIFNENSINSTNSTNTQNSIFENYLAQDVKSTPQLEEKYAYQNTDNSDEVGLVSSKLEEEIVRLENDLKSAKKKNGWISNAWDWIKNTTGLGASSKKVEEKINNAKSELAKLKDDPSKMSEVYKNITGKELDEETIQKLQNPKEGEEVSLLEESELKSSLSNYEEGQKMATDTVADIVSGVAAVGVVAACSVAGICAAPFTAGASLGLVAAGIGIAGTTGSVVKIGLKASDCIGNEKEYGWKDAGYDTVTGFANGAMGVFSNGLGGTIGKGIMKKAGMEALETTVKTGAKATAVKIGAKTMEFGVDGALAGMTDSLSRDVGSIAFYGEEKSLEEIATNATKSTVGGFIFSPIIGAGMNIAGKAGSKLGNKLAKNSDEVAEAITKEISTKELNGEIIENSTEILRKNSISLDKIAKMSAEEKTQMLTGKGISFEFEKYMETDETFQRTVDLLDRGLKNYEIKEVLNIDPIKADALLDKGVDPYRIKELLNLDQTRVHKLLDKGVEQKMVKDLASLDSARVDKLLDKGIQPYYIKTWADIDPSRIDALLEKNVNPSFVKQLASYDSVKVDKYLDLGAKPKDFEVLMSLDESRVSTLLKNGADSSDVEKLINLDPNRVDLLLKKGANSSDILKMNDLDLNEIIPLLDAKIDSRYAIDLVNLKGVENYDPKEIGQILNSFGAKEYDKNFAATLSDFLKGSQGEVLDLREFNNYVKNIDFEKISQIAPDVKNLDASGKLLFADYHFQNGTKDFSAKNLTLDSDLTEYLTKNYVSSDQLSELMFAYPATNRNIGTMPDGWLKNIPAEKQAQVTDEIFESITNFQELKTRNSKDLSETLSKILDKKVDVKYVGSGVYGSGFKISTENSKDMCLKVFHLDGTPSNRHGAKVEVQLGLFANEYSNKFVKMHFGKVATYGKNDAFMVTEFLSDDIVPTQTGNVFDKYSITSTDSSPGHNMINGKIIDFGGVDVDKKVKK